QELWQVEANGNIFDTNLAEIRTWIEEGAVLRMDRVRKGNLRWIEAGKVPSLVAVFNAVESGQPLPPVVTTTDAANPGTSQPASEATTNPVDSLAVDDELAVSMPPEDVCSMHKDVPAAYVCDTCANLFCKTCPNSYGGTVK